MGPKRLNKAIFASGEKTKDFVFQIFRLNLIVNQKHSKTNKMSKAHPPELKKFMDKRIHLKINGNRAVEGILRGFDPFMNLVLDETIEFTKTGERNAIGMTVIRGNSVVMLDAKERI